MGAERRFRSTCAEATEALGEALGRVLDRGAVVALSGDLGAGKTTFVRGLARGLDVTEPATSPTFTLMQEHEGRVPFFHFDAWMAGREAAFLDSGGSDYLGGEGVAAVEWSERIAEHLPTPRIEVRLQHLSPEERGVRLSVTGPGDGRAALEALLDGLPSISGLVDLSSASGEPPGPTSVHGGA